MTDTKAADVTTIETTCRNCGERIVQRPDGTWDLVLQTQAETKICFVRNGQPDQVAYERGQAHKVHELTYAELTATPAGTALQFTNWPGKPSVPVTVLPHDDEDGNVVFGSGKKIFAMPDELTLVARAGLEA
jgi:hypothetical protein